MKKVKYENLSKFQYLSYFIGRAFLLSIFCFVGILALMVTVYFGDLIINLGRGKSNRPLFNSYVIVSQSMVPTININDAIIVKRIDHDNYKIGDIISFSSSDINYKGLTVTHRIVNKQSSSNASSIYTTKGDNNLVADYAGVKTDQIYGRVLFIIPKIGYIHTFFSKPSNFFGCLLIPILMIIGYDVLKITRVVVEKRKALSE